MAIHLFISFIPFHSFYPWFISPMIYKIHHMIFRFIRKIRIIPDIEKISKKSMKEIYHYMTPAEKYKICAKQDLENQCFLAFRRDFVAGEGSELIFLY